MAQALHYEPARRTADALLAQHLIGRIWARDVSVWGATPGDPVGKAVANRLGWLDVPVTMQKELDGVLALAEAVRRDGVQTVYLLGMGGSSLCAEVMRSVYGVRDGCPQLVVMDTTDEATIRAAASRVYGTDWRSTSAHRLDPPMPSSTMFVRPSRLAPSSTSRISATRGGIVTGTSSQPRRLRIAEWTAAGASAGAKREESRCQRRSIMQS